MKTIRQIIQQWYPNIRQTLIAGIIGLSISLSFYLGLLQRHFFSWTYLGYALIIAVAGLFAGWLAEPAPDSALSHGYPRTDPQFCARILFRP